MHRIAAVSTFLALLLGSTPLHADRILVIGDSWAAPIAPELQAVLHENGHTDITVDATPYIVSCLANENHGPVLMTLPNGLMKGLM